MLNTIIASNINHHYSGIHILQNSSTFFRSCKLLKNISMCSAWSLCKSGLLCCRSHLQTSVLGWANPLVFLSWQKRIVSSCLTLLDLAPRFLLWYSTKFDSILKIELFPGARPQNNEIVQLLKVVMMRNLNFFQAHGLPIRKKLIRLKPSTCMVIQEPNGNTWIMDLTHKGL